MERLQLIHFYLPVVFLIFISCANTPESVAQNSQRKYVMVIHGGAGAMHKENMSDEKEREYKEELTRALSTGHQLLEEGKTATDAVVAAINILEDSPLFNAGKGAVFTNNGRNELDASIMDGRTLEAGAVAGVTNLKNPIDAARAVMDHSRHVMLTGKGAEIFAAERGCDTVSASYFYTEERWNSLQRILETEGRNNLNFQKGPPKRKVHSVKSGQEEKYGTVGAVVLDRNGNLAAGTSTGGLTNKRFGRVGDSPIVGAGTYCNNRTAGVSCTGTGEYFMRILAAYRVSVLMELNGLPIEEAANQVIDEIGELGGDGGLIALDHQGRVAAPFNTSGMFRGMVDEEGNIYVSVFREDE